MTTAVIDESGMDDDASRMPKSLRTKSASPRERSRSIMEFQPATARQIAVIAK